MKKLSPLLLLVVCCFFQTSCLFKEAIFSTGFVKIDATLAGVWTAEPEDGDPRGREFAVLVPVGQEAFMLHYPVGEKGSSYFEVRPLKVGEKDLWQVRLAAGLDSGIPKFDTPTYTLLWVEKSSPGNLSIRPLSHEGAHTSSAAAARQALETKGADWDKLFSEPKTFTRLPDR